jgi:hypothetical protein
VEEAKAAMAATVKRDFILDRLKSWRARIRASEEDTRENE